MRSSELHRLWGAPDNSRLTAKQQSFRLPVHVAAKIAALCELYPNKTKTEIVGDLLAAALDEVVEGLPARAGAAVDGPPDGGVAYREEGLRAEFRRIANRHYKALEQELGNKTPKDLYSGQYVVTEDEL